MIFFKIASHLKMVTRVGLVKDQGCNSVPGLTGIPGENLVNGYWLEKPGTIAKNNYLYIIMIFLQDPEHCQMPDLFGFFGYWNVEPTLLY